MPTLSVAGGATGSLPQQNATQAGNNAKGVVAQYQKTATAGGDNWNQNILPAGPGWRIAGSDSAGATNNNILGTTPPGRPGIPLVRTVIQNSSNPIVCGAAQATGEVIGATAPSSTSSSTPALPTGKPQQQADNWMSPISTLPSAAQLSDVQMGIPTKNAAEKSSTGLSLSQDTE